MASTLYRSESPGDWGVMQAPTTGGEVGNAMMRFPNRPDIYYRFWRVGAPQTLLLMHGLGAHSGWFIDMGNEIAARGVNVYAIDHQGFGRSGGTRGHVEQWQTFLTDIDHLVDVIHQDVPNQPLFMLGHSMGGVFATHYASLHGDKLAGVILMNPWIADTTKLSLGRVLSILLGGMRGSDAVVRLPDTGETRAMTTNPEADKLLREDTYWVNMRTKAFYWQITQMRGQTLRRAKNITIPTLVLQADNDLAVTIPGTRKVYATIPSADKTYTNYPNYDHDSEFQPDRTRLDDDIVTWVKAHGAPPAP
jgi:alpha-beta hydrolase superfamily lysophospholipase